LKKGSKIFFGFIGILIVLILAILGGNMFIENKLVDAIDGNFEKTEFKYNSLNANILSKSASILKPVYHKNGLKISAEIINLDGIDILEYLSNKKLEISNLKVTQPKVIIYTGAEKKNDSSENGTSKMDLLIKSLEISNGSLKITKSDSVKFQFFAQVPSLKLEKVSINQKSIKNGLPFNYKDLQLRSDSLILNLNKQHDLSVNQVIMQGDSLKFSEINIRPLYSKQEFQKHIPYEKDRFDISLNELVFKSFNWNFLNDSLKIVSDNTWFKGGDISIYRDKRVKDDPRRKPMYSKMIRELPFKIKLDTVKVQDFSIQYEELVKPQRGVGKVTFKNLNATIYNLTNVGLDTENFPRTDIDVRTQFMGEASLNVDWSFDISNKAEAFRISGQMDRISNEGINQFLKPALNVKAEGGIRDMRFNFSGNQEMAIGDMKLVYHNFKVEVLKEDGEQKNEFLSAIANLLINNNVTSGEKEQENIKTQRDPKKSFWNYLWKNIRNGALKSFL
jgi:hypothetical protein